MTDISSTEIASLVEPGRVHHRVYTDRDIFRLEMERIFGHAWLFVAHESQVPAHGDFVRSRMGLHEVLVTRDGDGALHVLLNSCAHRGARLCQARKGNQRTIVCPYHSWAFRLDGSLSGLPHRKSYPPDFDIGSPENGLKTAPRVASYRGFVFASMAPDGPDLETFLGPMTSALDNLIDRSPEGEIEQAGGSFRLLYPGNWKLHHENANDTVHPGFVHESSVASARAEDDAAGGSDEAQTREMMEANGFSIREWEGVDLYGSEGGHSYMGGFYKTGLLSPDRDDPVMNEYRSAMEAAYGTERTEEILGLDRFNNLIYPNISVNAQYHQIRIVHPVDVDKTIVQSFCFRLRGAPDEIFRRAVRFLRTLGSPASMIFSDDVEIFGRVQAGLQSGGTEWLNTARGMSTDIEQDHGLLGSQTASELPVRAQMGAWLDFMTAGGQR